MVSTTTLQHIQLINEQLNLVYTVIVKLSVDKEKEISNFLYNTLSS